MLGFVRTSAAPLVGAFIVALALGVSGPASIAEAKTPSEKKGRKQAAPPVDDEPDLEITVLDSSAPEPEPPPEPEPEPEQPPKKAEQGEEAKATEAAPDDVEGDEADTPKEPPPEPAAPHKNWITLTVQQDLLALPSEANVCPSFTETGLGIAGSPVYSCRDASGVYQGPVTPGLGNSVEGGLGFATTRILVGYDRVFFDRLTVGGRLGWAFGTTPSAEGVNPAVPFHLELRSAFYFGSAPFERRSVRPFVSLGGGMGEIDTSAKVEIYQTDAGPVQEVDAWRNVGRMFLALGGGAAYPVGDVMLNAELRTILLFPTPGFALGIALGGAYGF